MKRNDLLNTVTENKSSAFVEAIGDTIAYAETVGEVKANIVKMRDELTDTLHKMEDMDDNEFLSE